MNLSKAEFAILLSSIGLTLFGLGFFVSVDESNNNTVTAGMKSIGQVMSFSNDSRRKLHNANGWYQAKTDEMVFSNDSFFTGPDSSLEVKLEDGSLIKLGPNSLIVLSKTNQIPTLELRAGTMSFKSESKQDIQVKTKGQILTLKPSEDKAEVALSKSSSDEIKIVSNEGTIQVDNGQSKVEISEEKQLVLSIPKANEPEKPLKMIEAPRAPEPSTTTTASTTTTLPQSLFATKEELQAQASSTTLPPTTLAPLPPLPIVELLSPENEAEIIAVNKENVTVVFEWEGNNEASSYEVQVAENNSFSDFKTLNTNAPLTFLDLVAESKVFYWRVRAKAGTRVSRWSEVRHFKMNPLQ